MTATPCYRLHHSFIFLCCRSLKFVLCNKEAPNSKVTWFSLSTKSAVVDWNIMQPQIFWHQVQVGWTVAKLQSGHQASEGASGRNGGAQLPGRTCSVFVSTLQLPVHTSKLPGA